MYLSVSYCVTCSHSCSTLYVLTVQIRPVGKRLSSQPILWRPCVYTIKPLSLVDLCSFSTMRDGSRETQTECRSPSVRRAGVSGEGGREDRDMRYTKRKGTGEDAWSCDASRERLAGRIESSETQRGEGGNSMERKERQTNQLEKIHKVTISANGHGHGNTFPSPDYSNDQFGAL